MRLAACLVSIALAGPGHVRADDLRYWARLTQPDKVRAQRLCRDGRALLQPAMASLWAATGMGLPLDFTTQRALALESARTRFSLARELDPSSRSARMMLAQVLMMDAATDPALAQRAQEELTALRALDPSYAAEQVAFQLGLLHAQRGELAHAREEYERALALRSDDTSQATQLLDLAEVTMFGGELPRALALYQRAAREGEAGARVLALWGSAVAQDRMGEHAGALETARRALTAERTPFAALHRGGVFFVPSYELSYYEALGALALAEAERLPGEPWRALFTAARTWLRKASGDPSLSTLERALSPLTDELPHWREPLARASRGVLVPRASAARDAELPLPPTREGRALLWALRALAGFTRYLADGGAEGPFAEDAGEHVEALKSALSDSK